MSSLDEFEHELDRWGRSLMGWSPARAINACTVVRAYIEGQFDRNGRFRRGLGRPRSEEKIFLLLAEAAWLYVIDAILDGGPLPDGFRAEILRGMSGEASGTAIEGVGAALANLLPSQGVSADLRQRWLDLAVEAVDGGLTEAKLSREMTILSYHDYLAIGKQSIAVAHHLLTIAIAYDIAPLQESTPRASQLVHHLAIAERLRNDLASVEKERREGTRANAILLLCDSMSERSARSFLAHELERYEALVDCDAEALGDEMTRRVARVVMASADALYRIRTIEYPAVAAVAAAGA